MNQIFKFSNLLPTNYIILGIVAFVFSVSFVINSNYIPAAILILASGAVFTARSGFLVNTKDKTIRDYYSVFGIKSGKPQPYNELQKLAIKSGRYSQTMGSRGTTTKFVYDLYTLCIIIDEEVYELKSSKKEEKMQALMTKLGKEMGIPVDS